MLLTAQPRSEWLSLFDQHTPDAPVLLALLSGQCPGVGFVDKIDHPSQAVVRALGGEMFASVGCRDGFLNESLKLASQLGPSFLIDSGIPESTAARGTAIERIHFSNCDLTSDALRVLRQQLPAHLDVRVLDRDLLACCPFAGQTLPKLYGEKLDSYFNFGYGICLARGESVVCEVYAGYVAEGFVEVIVGTVESHRGQGLASVAGALFADAARQRGHQLTWSTRVDNLGSIRLARRLGFQHERSYRMIAL